jgi:phosphoribosylglycinamide formyltransferase-1
MAARIAVLVSGDGTNLQALLDDPVISSWIAVVVSDRPGVRALERARTRDVETLVVRAEEFADRDRFTLAMLDAMRARRIDVVVSAGYRKVLGAAFADAFAGSFLNVHPALLPAFPGAHAVRDALAWGAKVTGVTVHLVDDKVDHGPIVAQEAVAILPDDDWASLERRIHDVEHRLLPAAVRALVEGRIQVDGRGVRVMQAAT